MKDIDSPQHHKFKTNRVIDPLNPVYQMQTASRRHVLTMGQIEGSMPKQHKSPTTKRLTNIIDDIQGAKAKDRQTIPPQKKQEL